MPCRPGTAAAAAAVIAGTIVLALRGIARTVAPAAEGTGDRPLLGHRVRGWYKASIQPVQDRLIAWGVHPDLLTWAQLGVSILAGLAFTSGAVFLAGWLTILAGTLDILDGGLARARGTASPRGAFLDSVVDRWAEFATFAGLGALFRDSWVLAAVAVAAFGSVMVSYARARAEGLGLAMVHGNVQRPERYVLLGFGAWVSGLAAHAVCAPSRHPILATAICVLAALSLWTALRRSQVALRALGHGAKG